MATEFGPSTLVTEPFQVAYGKADSLITTLKDIVDEEGGGSPCIPGTPLSLGYSGSRYDWLSAPSTNDWVSGTSVEVRIPRIDATFRVLGRSIADISGRISPMSVWAARGNELGGDFRITHDANKGRVRPYIAEMGYWDTGAPRVVGEPNNKLVERTFRTPERYYPDGGYPEDVSFSKISPLEADRFGLIVKRVTDAVEALELIFQGEDSIEVLQAMGLLFPRGISDDLRNLHASRA